MIVKTHNSPPLLIQSLIELLIGRFTITKLFSRTNPTYYAFSHLCNWLLRIQTSFFKGLFSPFAWLLSTTYKLSLRLVRDIRTNGPNLSNLFHTTRAGVRSSFDVLIKGVGWTFRWGCNRLGDLADYYYSSIVLVLAWTLAQVLKLILALDASYIRLTLSLNGRRTSCGKCSGRDLMWYRRTVVRRRWSLINRLYRLRGWGLRSYDYSTSAVSKLLTCFMTTLSSFQGTHLYSLLCVRELLPCIWFEMTALANDWRSLGLGSGCVFHHPNLTSTNFPKYYYVYGANIAIPTLDLATWSYTLGVVLERGFLPLKTPSTKFLSGILQSNRQWYRRMFRITYYVLSQRLNLARNLWLQFWCSMGELFENKPLVVFFALLHISIEFVSNIVVAFLSTVKSTLQSLSSCGYDWGWLVTLELFGRWESCKVVSYGFIADLFPTFDSTRYLITFLDACVLVSNWTNFIGLRTIYWSLLILFVFTHKVMTLTTKVFVHVWCFLRWYVGKRRCNILWKAWMAVVEYHDDIVEEAFTRCPPANHPTWGWHAYRIMIRFKFDRRTKRWVPKVPKGKEYKPQGRGMWSTNRVVRMMRRSKLIYHKFRMHHRLNTEIRWARFFTVVLFVDDIYPQCRRMWFEWEDRTELKILRYRYWKRWKVIQPVINAACNLEEIFLSYTVDLLFDKPLVTKIESAKLIFGIWFTKWVNLFTNGYKLLMNLNPLLCKFDKVLDQLELILPNLRVRAGRNVNNLTSFRRGWLSHQDSFTAQVNEVVHLYLKSGRNVGNTGVKSADRHWTEFVNHATLVEADWITKVDPHSPGVDTDLLHWLANLSGYPEMDTRLIDATSGLFRLQNGLLRDADHLIQSVDFAFRDIELLICLEVDLMSVEDTLTRSKKSLARLYDGVLSMDTLTINTIREKHRLITARDRFFHLTRAVFHHQNTLRLEIEKLIQTHKNLKINTPCNVLTELLKTRAELDEWVVDLNSHIANLLTHSTVPTLWDYQQWEQNVDDLLDFKEALTSFKRNLRLMISTLVRVNDSLLRYSSGTYVTELMRIAGRWQLARRDFVERITLMMSYTDLLLEAPEHCISTQEKLARVTYQLNCSVSECVDLANELSTISSESLGGEDSLTIIRKESVALRHTITELRDLLPIVFSFFAFTFGLPLLYCLSSLPLWLCVTFLFLSGPVWYCLLQFSYLIYKYC